ncbi:MAG: EVE domain-containing protein [Deltaproteobacteria bacterium]|nr:EVE domain-containing protein [Deltaproteobacteria bacterium]
MSKKPIKNFWLMKTEPDVFSFEDLVKAPNSITHWEGVRNYQARNFMRDLFKIGDQVLIYHSNIDEPAVFGVASVVREGYPDSFALDPKSNYFDEQAKKKGQSPWIMVDVKATHRLKNPVTRERLKNEPRAKSMMVLQRGARLSVQPVSEEHFYLVLDLGSPQKL